MTITGHRARETWRILREGGPRRLAQRASRRAYMKLGATTLDFPLELGDISDSHGLTLPVPEHRPPRGTPLTVGWLCTPPAPGSGGHTTMLRMTQAVEAAGHTCVLYLYDRFRGELARHEQVIRRCWPQVRAEVRSADAGLDRLDAYVASSWQTAHVLAARSNFPTHRFYLIQDYEPFFYPKGTEYIFAEDTYRFGFKCITVGWMVASMLKESFGVSATVAAHGCDTSVYRLTNHSAARSGVVFYARPGVARRGYELGALALQNFHRRHPEQEIHIFGDASATVPFPATRHAKLKPEQLSALYNQCRAGIAMSFTNVSLIPAEMLACGAVPVVGGVRCPPEDLDSPYVRWAEPTPHALAEQLSAAVEADGPLPGEIAASVRTMGWNATQRVFLRTIEDEIYGATS